MTKHNTLLGGCRVLDLTDEKGLFCGKVLGDFGADVIKIERPGGDAARNIGPVYCVCNTKGPLKRRFQPKGLAGSWRA